MIVYRCDGCGKEIPAKGLRYIVRVDVRAAYEKAEIGLTELVREHRTEILELIDRLKDKSAEDIEETIYKSMKLDLCPACQRAYIRDPLHFHPEQAAEGALDIDGFLRSLGYGAESGPDTGSGRKS